MLASPARCFEASDKDVRRLYHILPLRALGLGLEEIASLLDHDVSPLTRSAATSGRWSASSGTGTRHAGALLAPSIAREEVRLSPMSAPHHPAALDDENDQVRRRRLREDGLRPLAVNLEETIALTRKLFELREAMLRAR